ncbi:tetratricopeptide repeat protein [Terrimonas rubra]|uniref:Tetratricopeptide repeat protein n=1 Tax=Terrimonas rubra TaxID=1035890 RepID=A0ABW6A390_9BACT
MRRLSTILSGLIITGSCLAQTTGTQDIKDGNQLYQSQEYAKAEEMYTKVPATDKHAQVALYNKANALYKQKKGDEALQLYNQLIADNSIKKELLAKIYYNKGVIFSAGQKLPESIEAYKQALRLNPDDTEARENLQKALLELKAKQPPPEKKKEENKKQQKEQQTPQPSKLKQKQAQQQLELLRQKEKQIQERLQNQKSKEGTGGVQKDW